MIRRSAAVWFLTGLILGALLAAPTGALLALDVQHEHPNLADELLAHLPGATPTAGMPNGNLADEEVTINTPAKGSAISPYIYGVAGADASTLRALGATLDRWGGNNSSRYNWVLGNAWNAARDWGFRNGNYGIQGNAADQFIGGANQADADALITIPSLGWVARNTDNSTQSVGVPSQGGAPLTPGGSAIAGYDPAQNQALTSVPSDANDPGSLNASPSTTGPVYEDQWVHVLERRYGKVAPLFYAIDNEPDLWCETHTDVHPACMSYDQMASMFETYASAVRKQAPNAQILGPVLSGWSGMFYSSLDRGTDNFATHADRNAHGDEAFLPWWLQQIHRYDVQHGVRTLNAVDVHWYPQGADVYSAADDTTTAALRVRSVRSLWDPSYTDESWIGQPVYLIPRLKQWVAADYPGTKVGISEYNFGGERSASGAVALAEALGTFGQQGLYLATYWTYPPAGSPANAAFRLYRNYDGKGSAFGNTSLPLKISQAGVRAYASIHTEAGRQHGEVDTVLTNESETAPATVRLAVQSASRGTIYLVPPGKGMIVEEKDVPLNDVQLPPMSAALVVVAA